MHKSGYNYPKNTQSRIGTFNVTGKSILWTPCMRPLVFSIRVLLIVLP